MSLDEGKRMSWHDAQNWTSSTTLPSEMSWSIPSKNTLQQLFCAYIGVPTTTWNVNGCPLPEVSGARDAFDDKLTAANGTEIDSNTLWSSEDLVNDYAWEVSFQHGGSDSFLKRTMIRVRAVASF